MADVFISYKSERRKAARHMSKVLGCHGFSTWYDYGLIPGEDFEPRLMAELGSAKAVVVLWCELSVNSSWVLKEATEARRRKTFLPVWIQKAKLPSDFASADTIDLSSWTGEPRSFMLDKLLVEIGRRIGRDPQADFHALRELDEDWRGFGAPTLANFGLSPAYKPLAEPAPTDAGGYKASTQSFFGDLFGDLFGGKTQQITQSEQFVGGTVKFFNAARGFGFITPDDRGVDVFVHVSAVTKAGLETLVEGQRITFQRQFDKNGKTPKAVNLSLAK